MSKRKNIVASIKGQLLHIAKSEGKNHQLLLLHYFQERFLFRLSRSEYRQYFCLKGAAFLYVLEGEKSRVTKDIDFLGIGIPSNHENIHQVVLEICRGEYKEDGNYQGVRISVTAHLERTKERLQIDVGFGDAVIPTPMKMTYPVILELEAPELLTYSIESLVAEKFEAMISLADFNSCMKDFYDVYRVLPANNYDEEVLQKAIAGTIARRNTSLSTNHAIFSVHFEEDEKRNSQWQAFLKRANLEESLAFSDVMDLIKKKLKPIYTGLQG